MHDPISGSGTTAMAARVVPALRCWSRFRRLARRVGVRGHGARVPPDWTAVIRVDGLRLTPGERDGPLLPVHVQGVAPLEFLTEEFQQCQRLLSPAEMGVTDVAQRRRFEDE